MGEHPEVKLEKVAVGTDEATFSVVVDGYEVGKVPLVKYYEPVLETTGPYVALWAGPTLCSIDREHGAMRCVDRGETHRVHLFENLWIVEGELRLELFDPQTGTTAATYSHNEVITSSSVADGLVHIRDYYGATITLDPQRSLQVVQSRP
jgi:hypothetical protein